MEADAVITCRNVGTSSSYCQWFGGAAARITADGLLCATGAVPDFKVGAQLVVADFVLRIVRVSAYGSMVIVIKDGPGARWMAWKFRLKMLALFFVKCFEILVRIGRRLPLKGATLPAASRLASRWLYRPEDGVGLERCSINLTDGEVAVALGAKLVPKGWWPLEVKELLALRSLSPENRIAKWREDHGNDRCICGCFIKSHSITTLQHCRGAADKLKVRGK